MYPVESRLFMKCVMNNESERKYLGPFPMLDLSSLLMAAGYDPLIDRAELLDEDEKQMMANKTHIALNDAEMTAAIWFKLKGYLKVK